MILSLPFMVRCIFHYNKLIDILACEYFSENLKIGVDKTTQRTR